MPPGEPRHGTRDELIDALRGIALFGILAVNIQSYLLGLNASSLGVLSAASSLADHLTVVFTAFLLHYKFYPIFCFCFGYGFAVQTRRWRSRGIDAARFYARRTDFMLGMGVLHGVFLWFGDILTTYALAGKVLARYIGKGPRQLLQALKWWGVLFLVVAVPVTVALTTGDAADSALDAANMARDAKEAFETYTRGSYWESLSRRAGEYAVMTLGFLLVLPGIMVIALMGALCAQLGLLRRHRRHRAFWWRALVWGLVVGLPVNAWHAWGMWRHAGDPWRQATLLEAFPADFAPLLSVAYVAAAALAADTAFGSRILSWFAPAGRLSLSNYVAQSVLMGVLLSGFGLGLGATLTQVTLLRFAVGIYLLLLFASHAMARLGAHSPLEEAWRCYTNQK